MNKRTLLLGVLLALSVIANLVLGIGWYTSETAAERQESFRIGFEAQRGYILQIVAQLETLKTADVSDAETIRSARHQMLMSMESFHTQLGYEEGLFVGEEVGEPPQLVDRWLIAHTTRNALLAYETDPAHFADNMAVLHTMWSRLLDRYTAADTDTLTIDSFYRELEKDNGGIYALYTELK